MQLSIGGTGVLLQFETLQRGVDEQAVEHV